MLNQLITFLIVILIGGCVIYAINWFVGLLAIPAPIKNVILIIVAIVALIWLLSFLGLYSFPR